MYTAEEEKEDRSFRGLVKNAPCSSIIPQVTKNGRVVVPALPCMDAAAGVRHFALGCRPRRRAQHSSPVHARSQSPAG